MLFNHLQTLPPTFSDFCNPLLLIRYGSEFRDRVMTSPPNLSMMVQKGWFVVLWSRQGTWRKSAIRPHIQTKGVYGKGKISIPLYFFLHFVLTVVPHARNARKPKEVFPRRLAATSLIRRGYQPGKLKKVSPSWLAATPLTRRGYQPGTRVT